jgi:hypothetical protein
MVLNRGQRGNRKMMADQLTNLPQLRS